MRRLFASIPPPASPRSGEASRFPALPRRPRRRYLGRLFTRARRGSNTVGSESQMAVRLRSAGTRRANVHGSRGRRRVCPDLLRRRGPVLHGRTGEHSRRTAALDPRALRDTTAANPVGGGIIVSPRRARSGRPHDAVTPRPVPDASSHGPRSSYPSGSESESRPACRRAPPIRQKRGCHPAAGVGAVATETEPGTG